MRSSFFMRFFTLVLCPFILANLFSFQKVGNVIDRGCYMFENKTDRKNYIVKVDYVDGSEVDGRMYLVDSSLILRSEPFSLVFDKNNFDVTVSDTALYVLNMNCVKDGKMEGVFFESLCKKEFVIYPYKVDDYQVFGLGRYRNEIFEVEVIPDVNYAKVEGFWTSIPDDTMDVINIVRTGILNLSTTKNLDLDMDIYIPKGDTIDKRPLMMFIHGGAFFFGDKATVPYQKWCTHFASLGYVCVSINYRIGFRINSKSIQRTIYQATQDAHAAMRYLVSKKDIYRIDTDYIFVGGPSAGGIVALNLAYMRNVDRPEYSYSGFLRSDLGDIECSGNTLCDRFEVRAVANMWGAVCDIDILENSKTSIVSFHGDKDKVLSSEYGCPFGVLGGFMRFFIDDMYGSKMLHKKALELGIRSELHMFYGQGHSLHLGKKRSLSDNFYTIQNEITDFFYEELNPHPAYIVQDKNDCQLFMIDTTDVADVDWNVVGGVSLEESDGFVRAAWFDDDLYHELRVSGYYKNGVGFEDVFVIKDVKQNENNSHK